MNTGLMQVTFVKHLHDTSRINTSEKSGHDNNWHFLKFSADYGKI